MISTLFAVMSVFTTTLFGGPARTDVACNTCIEDDFFDVEDDSALPLFMGDRANVTAAIERAKTTRQDS